ncbi:MAG: alpha/beta fold hydrolase [Proteobacteria bacterium]|nr:alpha/beta fold hydrolase [Pseudomonadota bacterium]
MKWLILRGLVREQRHWGEFKTEFEAFLRETDPGAEVFSLDFPGFGTEAHRPSPFTIDGIVDDLRARWQKLRSADETWCLLAISLGGMVAMNWTSRYASDFKRLVLINSSATGLSPLHKRMKPENYPKVLSLFGVSDLLMRERRILELTSNIRGQALEERARRHAAFALKVKKRDAFAQMVSAVRFRPPESIPVPLLVVAGKGDSLVDYSCSEKLAEKYRGKIVYHETANHDLVLDEPCWLMEQVRSWADTAV